MAEFTEQEKAEALDDLVYAFCEEYWDIEGDHWVVLDGSVKVSSDTARVLEAMFQDARGRKDPEWLRCRLDRQVT